MKTKRINTVETAKIVKQILKDYWPDIKFSVRSDKYAGGSSVRVQWTDGPTEAQVKRITDYFEGANFDGMRDLKTYKSKLEVDENGEQVEVKYGPDFIFPSRSYSVKFVKMVAQMVIDDFGLDQSLLDEVKENSQGKGWWDVRSIRPDGWHYDLQTKFHQYRCKIEATPEGEIKKHRISASYLKKLAAKAYTEDDEYIFTAKLEDEYNLTYEQSWDLYQQYLKSLKLAS